jgi:AcrR family transcriptional regulator
VTTDIDGAEADGRGRLPRSARRAQLMGAARDVFVAQGYHAAAMDDIAERAGVSKPVLYQHFPGKLDLYLALIDRHADELVSTVRAALASTTDNRERVARAIAAYFEFVDRDGEAFRLVFENDLRSEPVVADRVEAALRSCVEAITEVVVSDTELPLEDARLLAVGLTGLAEVSARWWLEQGGRRGPVSKERAVGLMARLSWRGIGGFPPPARVEPTDGDQ